MTDSLLTSLWNLIFPRRCAGCGKWGAWLCPSCAGQIPIRNMGTCPGCGLPAADWSAHAGCRRGLALDGLLAMAGYGPPLKPAIHLFKYRFVTDVGATLGEFLAGFAVDKLPAGNLLVVPVPLHKERFRWRGFNQSAVLAREVATRLGLAYDEGVLVRERATEPQVNLHAASRRTNLRGAFRCQGPEKVSGRTMVVVDDVATTLTTLEECAKTLKAAGAKQVWGLVLAQD